MHQPIIAEQPAAPEAADAIPAPAPPAGPVPLPPEVVRASLRHSIYDGMAWSVMHGLGAQYVAPFVILGGSGLFGIAAVFGLPFLAGVWVQWWSANVTDRFGRRRSLIVWAGLGQAAVWLPIAVAVFFPLSVSYWLMLAGYILYQALQNFSVPPWQSLMGDLVPPDRRGKYFGLRTSVCGALMVASYYGAGWWLTLCEDNPAFALLGLAGRDFGFLVMFGIAGLARLVSVWHLHQLCEVPYHRQQSDQFTLWQFIRRLPQAHYGRFVLYVMFMQIGAGFLMPFLSWQILDQLDFSPAAFATIMCATLVINYATQPLWGRLLDRIGSKRVLSIGGVGLIGVPLLLLLCSEPWHFVLAQLVDGVLLAAFQVAVGNYFYDVVTPPKRARCGAYGSMFNALGMAMGAFAGAAVGTLVPLPLDVGAVVISSPFTLMVLGAVAARLLPNLLLLRSFDEFRLRRPSFAGECAQPA